MDSNAYAMISKDRVYAQIEASGDLPVLPEVLLTLLAACDDQERSLSDIADIISRDPALSLRVLQLVNSAYYGFRHSFNSIEQAVIYLGANTVKHLAVTTSVHQVFKQKQGKDGAQTEADSFWYHSLMSATIARRLALETGGCNADEAYLAGLLHDVGKLLLVSAFPRNYRLNSPHGMSSPEDLRQEVDLTGLNHCEAGSWLVRKWNLGSLVADAIEYHHEPLEQVAEAFPLVKIVYLANVLAKGGRHGDRIAEIGEPLLGPGCDELALCVANAAEEVDEIAADIGIRVTPPQADGPARVQPRRPSAEEAGGHDRSAPMSIAARVRSMSLLVAFQEELMQAEDLDAVLAAFEKAMAILFDISNVLFFLPESDGVLLRGRVSGGSRLRQTSKGLTFPVRQSTSLIVKVYQERQPQGYIVRDRKGTNIADQQILAVFGCSRALPVPLVAENGAVGVILLGLPEGWDLLSEDDQRLVRIIGQQVALRLHLEREKAAKAEALNRERMAAISATARKLAHEINNPLGIIGNYLVTLKLKLSGEQEVLEELAIIDEEIQRISMMVSQMEMYSQAPFSRFEPLDVNSVVRDIIQIAKPSLFQGGGPTVSFIPGTDLPAVTTSKDAVKQVLINLLKNAAEAMEDGGRVIVRTRKSQPDGLGDGGGVEVIVADSGPGLPEIVMQNLYKPFVTTKTDGHSGLGLSIVQKVVGDIGGKLSCLSSPAEGTTFTIYLPGILPDRRQ